jgi:rod shape determining protein RodA
MVKKGSIASNLDYFTILMYLILVFLGWVNIYAAVYNDEHHSIFDMSQKYGKQMIWILAAFGMAIILLILDSSFYLAFGYIIYAITVLMLIAVLVVGTEVNGARSWFTIGAVRLQPAEFAKFAVAMAVAKYLNEFSVKISKIKTLLIIVGLIAVPAGLIFLQRDTGSALIYLSFSLLLYREGLSGTYLVLGLLTAVLFILALQVSPISIMIGLTILAFIIFFFIHKKIVNVLVGLIILIVISALFMTLSRFIGLDIPVYFILIIALIISGVVYFYWAFLNKERSVYIVFAILMGTIMFTFSVNYLYNNVLQDHQRTRINVLLGIEEDIKGAGYNVHQSMIAIGSGGVSGKGFLQGTQTKLNYVPEQSTDFIFCTIGEEWGFVGTTLIIVLFIIFLLRLIYLAERQRSSFSRVYGYGVVSILFFHLAINVGMTIGLAPVIGIPLPFFSYGGSSLWAFTILLFVFLRLDASREELLV